MKLDFSNAAIIWSWSLPSPVNLDQYNFLNNTPMECYCIGGRFPFALFWLLFYIMLVVFDV